MFGLVLAALYVGCCVIFSNADATTSAGQTTTFLYIWHGVISTLVFLLTLLIPLIGLLVLIFGKGGEKVAGAGLIFYYPVLLVMLLIGTALFIGGTYCFETSLEWDANGVATVKDTSRAIVGGVLYGVGILFQLARRGVSASKKKD